MTFRFQGAFPRRFFAWSAPAALVFALLLPGGRLCAQPAWSTVGPDGGDARAFAAVPGDPSHLYLGTTDSWIYESMDGGASWHRLAKMPGPGPYVIDHIVVDSTDPATIYAAAWQTGGAGGGAWVTHDGGRTWAELTGLHDQAIFSFAQAPSNPRILFAGTLQGVFRSTDGGAAWTEISPAHSREIHEIESLAIDPHNPNVIYAGTWHLPWKTVNGGKTWHNIKNGLIVDSDVFSIIVDPEHTRTVYLSACSGIYKSENAGLLFHKIHGIPSQARRTRVLRQDPANPNIVYAGTTEGLYKTVNAGRSFERMTDADVIVNDVFVDPGNPRHVLLATDRGGVLASENGGKTFVASNAGISERKVEALLVDRNDPKRIYAGVVNDKLYGGVFVSDDGGKSWSQIGKGLDGRDVYALAETNKGALLAGTNSGIFVLDPEAGTQPDPQPDEIADLRKAASAGDNLATRGSSAALVWQPRNTLANTIVKTVTETRYRTRVNVEKQEKAPVVELDGRVSALDVSANVWAASTSYGLLTSRDHGATWQGGPVMDASNYESVTVRGNIIAASRPGGVVLSEDKGLTWQPMGLPTMVTRVERVLFTPDGTLWLGAREGVYFTTDLGKTWMWIKRFPLRDVDDLSYDAASKRLLVSSRLTDQVYAIDAKKLTWQWWQTGYAVGVVRAAGDRLAAASLNDGVLLEPVAGGEMPAQRASLPEAH